MRLFDSHAHLTDERFKDDLTAVLERAREVGVQALVTIASGLEDAREAARLADATPQPLIRATAGIHPHDADLCTAEALVGLEAPLQSDRVVAVGETGLDFHYDNAPRQVQIDSFRAQLALAERLALPLVVHSREADEETAGLLEEFRGRVTGVLHCFTGGATLLEAGLAAGWYVSFSGIVTFKNYRDADLVRRVPQDHLLVETDSPYLAPVPVRGKRNEPAFVAHVVRHVAQIRGETPERVAEQTLENACRFYGLDNGPFRPEAA